MAILWYILAILVAFSRIYLEKHYPVDIIVGAIIGTLIGMLVEKVMVPKRLKKIYNQ
jgi:undecaprenyl-diphosphatase